MYYEFGGRTSDMYYEFARCRSSVSGDGTGNVRRPLNYSNAVQGLFDGVQGHSRAIQGFLFFSSFSPLFSFFIFSGQHYEITGPSVRMPSAGPYRKGHAPGNYAHAQELESTLEHASAHFTAKLQTYHCPGMCD